jgi:surface protein
LLHPLAVFEQASAFNQDVSKWNTGAVTSMWGSKCTLFPSLWPSLIPYSAVVFLNINMYDNSSFITILTHVHVHVCYFVFFETSLIAVFAGASVFNQDVSKWNSRAVTSMYASKYDLSTPPLSVAIPYSAVVFLNLHVRNSHMFSYFVVC